MTADHCPATLTPFAPGRAPEGGVIYSPEDRVLILADDAAGLALARLLAADRRVTLVAAAPVAPPEGVPEAIPALRIAQGRAASVSGWLGAFQVQVAHDADSHAVPHAADVVIDLCAEPSLARDVTPPGWLRGAPADAEALAARARALSGLFHKPRYFAYDPKICAHEAGGQRGCARCLDACGAEAIRSVGVTIEVEPHLCQGCAACTLACPTGALSVRAPDRPTLLARAQAALAADPDAPLGVGGPGAAVKPDVLAQFGEELWLAALAEGAPALALALEPDAPAATSRLVAERVALAQTIARAFGLGDAAVTLDAPPATPPEARAPCAPAAPLAPLDPRTKTGLRDAALARLEPAGFAGVALPDGAPLGTIVLDPEACILCGLCARFCPTGAIGHRETDEATLVFLEAKCVQCGACARGCPEQAITLIPRLAPRAERVLWRVANSGPMARCVETGAPFIAQRMLDRIIGKAKAGGFWSEAFEAQMRRAPEARQSRPPGG